MLERGENKEVVLVCLGGVGLFFQIKITNLNMFSNEVPSDRRFGSIQ